MSSRPVIVLDMDEPLAPGGGVDMAKYFKAGYVLVVDDMYNMRKTIRNMLRMAGIERTEEADDGDSALETLREKRGCRLILMDWNMPRMPGINVMREIRAEFPALDLPVLMITAEIQQEQVTYAAELNVSGYITKPFFHDTLIKKIQAVLDGRLNPPEHVKLLKAGEEYLGRGRHSDALEMFQSAMIVKKSARVSVAIGETMSAMGNFEKAVEHYNQAKLMNPQYLRAYSKLAEMYMAKGEDALALENLESAAAISPGNADRLVTIGNLYFKLKKPEQGQACFSMAISHDRKKCAEVAEILLEAGHAAEAEKYFRMTVERGQVPTVARYNRLGIALRRQGKWREAIKEYENSLAIDDKDAAIHFNMGKAYLEGGQKAMSCRCFERALALNPHMTSAMDEIKALKTQS